MPVAPESKVRARVSRMGLATVKMNTAAKDLSGGEKARLLMGLATFQGPNLLILDEPTNHLDIDSREALMHALNDFDGAVILIAHDRHLIEATMDRLWLVRDGGVAPYDGDLDAYRSLVLADAKAERSGNKIVVEEGQKLSKAEQRKLAAQKREALKPLQKKIQEAEAQVHRFQKKIDSLQIQLADPVIYTREPAKATQIGKEIGYAKSSLARAEEEWLTLSGEYEDAMTELAQ